jgi:hypothetical protein
MFYLQQCKEAIDYTLEDSEFVREYPTEIFTDPARYSNPEGNLLGYCAEVIEESGAFVSFVECGPVRRGLGSSELMILLMQLPDVVKALFNPCTVEFAIDLDPIPRMTRIAFRNVHGGTYSVSVDDESAATVGWDYLRDSFLQFVATFVDAMRLIDPATIELPVFREWYAKVTTPLREWLPDEKK